MQNRDILSVKPLVDGSRPQIYIETYGCQMNVNDSEVVLSIMQDAGYALCHDMGEASLIVINTCSIRDNAEQRVLGRLDVFRQEKKRRSGLTVAIIGCMAERMKERLLENPAVDIVAGPDAYRDLPRLVSAVTASGKQINTILSHEETYADIAPVRMDRNGVSACISIMRGCNNVCSYCIVPYVRGSERSRDAGTVVAEARTLIAGGYKEINLLGQNVDSYHWQDITFARLLEMVAQVDGTVRVRFSTSYPNDISDDVLHVMARYDNICRHIHFPVQSGSNAMLERMNRKYTREDYLARVARIREILPDCGITTDVIAGFSGETDADHADTLSLLREVGYDGAFMFQYSERPGTKASRCFPDDVPAAVKTQRLNEIIALQNGISLENNRKCVGRVYEVLVEGPSKRSDSELVGRTSSNKSCVFPAQGHRAGEYVKVRVISCTSATLICAVV